MLLNMIFFIITSSRTLHTTSTRGLIVSLRHRSGQQLMMRPRANKVCFTWKYCDDVVMPIILVCFTWKYCDDVVMPIILVCFTWKYCDVLVMPIILVCLTWKYCDDLVMPIILVCLTWKYCDD